MQNFFPLHTTKVRSGVAEMCRRRRRRVLEEVGSRQRLVDGRPLALPHHVLLQPLVPQLLGGDQAQGLEHKKIKETIFSVLSTLATQQQLFE